ncbi:hypothetical protein AG1IA_02406 [Rhizoctonia solani AG-1 IA]|uniref:Small secreted protein n=1 Tax=Thanatephorus cucumeris (strain AG1-IA) TaxID=983506 RepID=L8X4N3_THACA|nr:hypothetical protein AG1IA_02406 [Rhizoctonia solani AG-1 IA]
MPSIHNGGKNAPESVTNHKGIPSKWSCLSSEIARTIGDAIIALTTAEFSGFHFGQAFDGRKILMVGIATITSIPRNATTKPTTACRSYNETRAHCLHSGRRPEANIWYKYWAMNKFNSSNKMVSSFFIYALLASASFVSSRPLSRTRSALIAKRQAQIFALKDYADFQISTGVAGDALARAEAVFKTPLDGVDLATVSDEDLDNLNTMRGAASKFETTDFNPAIKAATGEEADALQRGKIANKVLKNLGSVMVASIKEAKAKAAGEDPSEFTAKITEETTKMNKNAATDKADAGKALATPLKTGVQRIRSVKFARMANKHNSIKRQALMPLRDYEDFQISTGTAGDALARAEAVFKTPFNDIDLATVSDEDLKNLNTMRGTASKFETTDFNPAIKAATGEEAAALQRGKIANKVLKNLGSVMVASIKEAKAKAAGEDASGFTATIEEETKKMNKNAETDKADAGKALATVS